MINKEIFKKNMLSVISEDLQRLENKLIVNLSEKEANKILNELSSKENSLNKYWRKNSEETKSLKERIITLENKLYKLLGE